MEDIFNSIPAEGALRAWAKVNGYDEGGIAKLLLEWVAFNTQKVTAKPEVIATSEAVQEPEVTSDEGVEPTP